MYSRRIDDEPIMIGRNPSYCTLMRNYMQCMNETSKRCRGNLKFHTLSTLLKRQFKEFDCERFMWPYEGDNDDNDSTNGRSVGPAVTTTSPPPRCFFLFDNHRGRFDNHRGLRYCALFGDPHLRTFNGEFQTCRAEGAWPLVENGYFLVQVTNAPVVADHGATVLAKVRAFSVFLRPGEDVIFAFFCVRELRALAARQATVSRSRRRGRSAARNMRAVETCCGGSRCELAQFLLAH